MSLVLTWFWFESGSCSELLHRRTSKILRNLVLSIVNLQKISYDNDWLSGEFLAAAVSLSSEGPVCGPWAQEYAGGVVFTELSWINWLSNWVRLENCSLMGSNFTPIFPQNTRVRFSRYSRCSLRRQISDALAMFSAFTQNFGRILCSYVLPLVSVLLLREIFMQVMETWIHEFNWESCLLQ